MTSDDEKTRRRVRFEAGKSSGGKGISGAWWSGDPDFESGVKTHLLQEQNRLLKEAQEDAKEARCQAALDAENAEERRQGQAWLNGYAEHEKKWKPLTKMANVAKLSDNKLRERYDAASTEYDSVKRAKYDGRADSSEIGDIVKIALDNLRTESKRRHDKDLNWYVEEVLTEVQRELLKALEAVSLALVDYVNGYGKKCEPEAQLKKVKDRADYDSAVIAQVKDRLSPEALSMLESLMGATLDNIRSELMRGPKLASTYFAERKKANDSTIAVWGFSGLVVIGQFVLGYTLPFLAYPGLCTLPFVLQRQAFAPKPAPHLQAWTVHVKRVNDYAKSTERALMSFWEYPYKPSWCNATFTMPEMISGT